MASPENSPPVSLQSQSTSDEDSASTGILDLATDVDSHRAVLQRSEAVSIASVTSTSRNSATTTSNLVPTTSFASGHPATTVVTTGKATLDCQKLSVNIKVINTG